MAIQTQLNKQNFALNLQRFPAKTSDRSLRAWDAADEYIIDHLANTSDLSRLKCITIINDSFGALTCAVQKMCPQADIHAYTDSFMSRQGILNNVNNNQLKSIKQENDTLVSANHVAGHVAGKITLHTSLEFDKQLSTSDIVLLKVPRTLAYLKYLLAQIDSYASLNTPVIAGAMVKLVTSSVVKLFENYLPNTRTSLAKKKARLLLATQTQESLINAETPATPEIYHVQDPEIDFTLYNLPNVFCREQIDIGARIMLSALQKQDFSCKRIIDLGCGNGLLGIATLQQTQDCHMVFVDESYMAVASAKKSCSHANNISTTNTTEFIVNHSLQNLVINNIDCVLCNPPFHQQSTLTEDIA